MCSAFGVTLTTGVDVNQSTLILFTSRKISLGNGIFMSFEFFSFSFLFIGFGAAACLFKWMDDWMNYLWLSLCTYQLDWPESEMRSLFPFIWYVLVNCPKMNETYSSLCTHKCRNVRKLTRKLNIIITIFANTTFQRERENSSNEDRISEWFGWNYKRLNENIQQFSWN